MNSHFFASRRSSHLLDSKSRQISESPSLWGLAAGTKLSLWKFQAICSWDRSEPMQALGLRRVLLAQSSVCWRNIREGFLPSLCVKARGLLRQSRRQGHPRVHAVHGSAHQRWSPSGAPTREVGMDRNGAPLVAPAQEFDLGLIWPPSGALTQEMGMGRTFCWTEFRFEKVLASFS